MKFFEIFGGREISVVNPEVVLNFLAGGAVAITAEATSYEISLWSAGSFLIPGMLSLVYLQIASSSDCSKCNVQ